VATNEPKLSPFLHPISNQFSLKHKTLGKASTIQAIRSRSKGEKFKIGGWYESTLGN